ncbi:organic radical activating enzyme [Kibdelosporangium banguiense]|uniref:7-carboxy-7-deazaguanine synthase n=1 Tax=Kibdelosporangium banguiense TaxID=1365924 RepID=A0ABS4TN81_9PSEU|nr:7-carboxy-7-deazaguanine synthase QueE [Kibdelosporangium banguiense]MBP2325346.1 organic radical activating enzyme [Kibdelosporangium banguiense]
MNGPDRAVTLEISELFGPTVQGEGPSLGRQAGFLRLGGCNFTCSWCDSAYTWDGTRFDLRIELERRDVDDIAGQLRAMAVPLIVITGGEPLRQQRSPAFARLLTLLAGLEIEIETNGSIMPTQALMDSPVRFNIGVKLANSGVSERSRIREKPLRTFRQLADAGRGCFKAVCRDRRDVAELAALADRLGLDPSTVWVMPEGQTDTDTRHHLRLIAEPAIQYGFNITPRLHIAIWDTERGR